MKDEDVSKVLLGAIIGGAVGGVLGCCLCVVIAFLVYKLMNKPKVCVWVGGRVCVCARVLFTQALELLFVYVYV